MPPYATRAGIDLNADHSEYVLGNVYLEGRTRPVFVILDDFMGYEGERQYRADCCSGIPHPTRP